MKAAEQGDVSAQCALGKCYADGRGVKQGTAMAREWFQRAADQGYELAKTTLEQME